MNKRTLMVLGLVIVFGAVLGIVFSLNDIDLPSIAHQSDESVIVAGNGTYGWLSQKDMVHNSDLIAVGEITHISEPSFNSDSGEYWEPAADSSLVVFPVHTITIKVSEYLVGERPTDELVITVIGNSSVPSSIAAETASIQVGGTSEHDLSINTRGIFFLNETELVWREGNKSVLMFTGDPGQSYMIQGPDGKYHGGPEGIALELSAFKVEFLLAP